MPPSTLLDRIARLWALIGLSSGTSFHDHPTRIALALVGVILTAGFIRVNGDNMGIPLSNVEPLAYVVGAAIGRLASRQAARISSTSQPH